LRPLHNGISNRAQRHFQVPFLILTAGWASEVRRQELNPACSILCANQRKEYYASINKDVPAGVFTPDCIPIRSYHRSRANCRRIHACGQHDHPTPFNTATLLPDGRVLIAGGATSGAYFSIANAELYDPSTAVFTATGKMTSPRDGHTATLLPNGKVLIAGGGPRIGGVGYSTASAELYDVATGTFVATGSMTVERWGHTATLLDNGKVLIAGGFRRTLGSSGLGVDFPIGAELYDPSTGTFTATSNMTSGSADTATLLANGQVLITRSDPDGIVGAQFFTEIYDPFTGLFFPTGKMVGGSTGPTATLLQNGKVLIAGGDVGDGDGLSPLAQLFDPATGAFVATGNMIHGREQDTATLLPDGTVLFAGGHDIVQFSAMSELYDPATGAFGPTVSMPTSRELHAATLLNDGTVLITGGDQWPTALASALIYTPAVLVPALIVTDLQFDRMNVVRGSSYSVNLSGFNLTPDTFFDVRFVSPDGNESAALNWQRGLAQTHDILAGIAAGGWTINGVRAHRVETDHTGNFFQVSATITVSE
jgi:hypothetical protein